MDSSPIISREQYDLLSALAEHPRHTPDESQIFTSLVSRGYIAASDPIVEHEDETNVIYAPTSWHITIKGEDALHAFDQQAEKEAKEKGNKRNDRIFQILLAVLSFILGVIAECFSGLGETLIALITKQG